MLLINFKKQVKQKMKKQQSMQYYCALTPILYLQNNLMILRN